MKVNVWKLVLDEPFKPRNASFIFLFIGKSNFSYTRNGVSGCSKRGFCLCV